MKKLILSELLLLFLATTFMTDSPPPGWYQQTLPVNDQINDIFFLDSLTGWVVTDGRTNINDTGYVMKTTNGGTNWIVQYNQPMKLNAVQFTDVNTGYVVGGSGSGTGRIFKTTDGGAIWNNIISFVTQFTDIFFVNKDTGWVCDPTGFGGIFKTTDGGTNWTLQLGASFSIKKLFFINSDTGWAGSDEANGKLYRTTNSGQVWNLQYTSNGAVESIFFLNSLKGWIRGGTGNGVAYTTNGGLNWSSAQGEVSGYDVKFVNDSIGWAGGGNQPLRITKSTDGGKTWGYQNALATPDIPVAALRNDSLLAWAGRQLLIHTIDGGGTLIFSGIHKISNETPLSFKLYQNYPNPFNPKTNIKYQIVIRSRDELEVYDINGRKITTLVNEEQSPGTYQVDFSGKDLSSGVYFYKITISTGKEVFTDVKKMILLK